MILHSIALPTGPYDWRPGRIGRNVYEDRLEQVRVSMRELDISRLVVHGNGFDHAALTWLTGFTPKLGPGYALIGHEGPPRLLFAGGPGMRPSAARLTWIEDVTALKGIAADLRRWLGDSTQAFGLCEGRSMLRADWLAVHHAAHSRTVVECDRPIDALRRAKTQIELDLIRRASDALTAAAEKLNADLRSCGVRTAALHAERQAYAAGAQDVRIRIGTRPWSAPVPVERHDELVIGPTRLSIAARHAGYWAVGEFVAGKIEPDIHQRTRLALRDLLGRLRTGDIGRGAGEICAGQFCVGIGLASEEAPRTADGEAPCRGDVCRIGVSIQIAGGQTATWSVIAAIGDNGPQLLWQPPGLAL